METITVIGAGAWGTTLALLLARNGRPVVLFERFPEYGRLMAERRENFKFLPGFPLPEGIRITSEMEEADGAELFILAPPSFAFRETAGLAKEAGIKGPFLIATKGIEQKTNLRMSQVLRSVMGKADCAAVSGPNIAREVAAGLPAGAVCAAENEDLTALCRDALNSGEFRVYAGHDPVGVELGGSIKNPLAIAGGIAEGLGLGENSKAALLCRGLAEMARLGKALGGRERTFFGLSGLGDLVTTAYSPASRNHRFGLEVGRGGDPASIVAGQESVVEGYYTVRPVLALAEEAGVEMPICHQVVQVLFEGKSPKEAVRDLMTRPLKHE